MNPLLVGIGETFEEDGGLECVNAVLVDQVGGLVVEFALGPAGAVKLREGSNVCDFLLAVVVYWPTVRPLVVGMGEGVTPRLRYEAHRFLGV